jgi:hypothetical protein
LEKERDEATYSLKGAAPVGKRRYGVAALAGVGISLLAFVLYVMTLAPTVLPYSSPDLLDAAMLQVQVAVLGISHPTGYPTYLMLSHLFTYLPVGDVAYRANLASAAWAALRWPRSTRPASC